MTECSGASMKRERFSDALDVDVEVDGAELPLAFAGSGVAPAGGGVAGGLGTFGRSLRSRGFSNVPTRGRVPCSMTDA